MKASPPKILIVGAGFLGREIAHQAQVGGWSVFPVVRTEDSAKSLQLRFSQAWAADAVSPAFWEDLNGGWSGMVWAMAPSRKSGEGVFREMHRDGASRAAEWAKGKGVPMVYISSTSVYAESAGGWVEEGSPLAEDEERALAMIHAEGETVRAGGSVLRCAGLYGGERELRDRPDGPERWLNVIHLEDAARAVGIALRIRGEIFNVAEDQPLRRGTVGGVWAEESARSRRSKKVSNAKLKKEGWMPIHAAAVKDSSLPKG